MKQKLRGLIDGIPFCPVPVRLQCSSAGRVDFWWSRFVTDIDISPNGMIYRGSENGDLEFMKRYLKVGMSYIDIGAFHGLYAVVAGRQVGRGGRLVLFEPSAAACRRARLNLLLNRIKARVENVAVSETCGMVQYHQVVTGFETMGGLRRPPTADPVRTRQVRSTRLDDYCREHACNRIDLVKIDAEGAELSVLAGAGEVLATRRPLIICEVLDWVTQSWGYAAREIITKLLSIDYQWFDIDRRGRLSEHALKSAYPDIRNYLAVPAERLSEIRDLQAP